jgi:hypothetical protein
MIFWIAAAGLLALTVIRIGLFVQSLPDHDADQSNLPDDQPIAPVIIRRTDTESNI